MLVELIPKTINKGTFSEAVKRLLEEKNLIPSLKSTCSLEIRDLDLLTENTEVIQANKREYSKITYTRIGITICKLSMPKCEEIRVGWLV